MSGGVQQWQLDFEANSASISTLPRTYVRCSAASLGSYNNFSSTSLTTPALLYDKVQRKNHLKRPVLLGDSMKQLLQNISAGEGRVRDVPPPKAGPGVTLFVLAHSLVSAGTEKMVMNLQKKRSAVGDGPTRSCAPRAEFWRSHSFELPLGAAAPGHDFRPCPRILVAVALRPRDQALLEQSPFAL